jgi:hypothetical protein
MAEENKSTPRTTKKRVYNFALKDLSNRKKVSRIVWMRVTTIVWMRQMLMIYF